jgi:AcrR family transcriptional regulator
VTGDDREKLSPREQRRAETMRRQRADILNAALAAFAEKGFDGTQMGEIARASELSLATVYSMFGSKEALYHDVVEITTVRMRRSITGKVEAVLEPSERLLTLIDALLDCYEENKDFLRIFVRGTQGLPYKIRQGMGEETLEHFRAFTVWVTGIAEQASRAGQLSDLDPETVAYALIGTINTACAHWIEFDDSRPLTEAGPGIRALFKRTIGRVNG